MGIVDRNVVFGLQFCQVFVIVDKNRLDRCDFAVLYLNQEIARLVAVHRDRSNLGLGYFKFVGVRALAFVDCHIIVVAEILVSHSHYIGFGYFVKFVIRFHNVGPRLAVDKCVDIVTCSRFVALKRALKLQFGVVDDGRHEVVVEVAVA